MQIHELAALSGNPASGNVLAIDTGSVTRKIDYTALAKAIVEQYNGSTLAGSAQTVQAAINALNTSIGETAESIDTQAINQSYGALFPDTFWKKLTLINADVNNNDANNGALRPDRLYHIATESVLHFDHALTVSTTDATLQVADRIYAEDGTFISTNNWKRSITIPANAYFRLVFRAQPDDQSVTLDITTSMAKVTFAMASELSELAADVAGKVAISQGAANAGKALIVGDDGNVTLGEAGVPEAVKTALLNIFQHVAYTDDQGQTYYDALYAALYASAYPHIEATFNPGANAIYVDEGLNALKQYMVVKVYEDAEDEGTAVASTDYTLTGTLADGENTVVIWYDGMMASVQVEAVDYFNIWEWSSTGDNPLLVKLQQGISEESRSVPAKIWCDAGNTKRRSFVAGRGNTTPIYDRGTEQYMDVYPIPVPDAASAITTKVQPSTQYIAAYVFEQVGDYYQIINVSNISWTQDTQTFSLERGNGGKRFVVVAGKQDAGGNTYTVEPAIEITFT